MEHATLLERFHESEIRNEALLRELVALRASQNRLLEEFAALRRDYESLVDATRTLTEDRDALRNRAAELEAANARLVDMLWGRRSERRHQSPGQRQLEFPEGPAEPTGDQEQDLLSAETQANEAADRQLLARLEARRKARRKRRQQAGREEFPPTFERRERVLDLPEDQKQGLKPIGVKVTQRLRFENPHAYVEVIKRPQYVVPDRPEAGVRSAPPPLAIVEGCKYDFSVIAAILAMKFAFHMPTYRQQDWFAQVGWFPSRSTANDLVGHGVETMLPLFGQMWRVLLAQPILAGDDTTLRVLLRGALDEEDLRRLGTRSKFRQAASAKPPPDGSATSYAWLYTGLDGLAPYNVFHWSLGHHNAVIDGHLAAYQGVFVGDAAGVNAHLGQRSGGRIVHASCNAHARREFVKAESNDPILASQAISFYRQLYDVEERGKTLDAAARFQLRQRDSVPIWARMRCWLESDAACRALPQSAIGKAISYLRNQWSALQIYLIDGRIPIDNDHAEQTIRPLVVGRRNWLFLGHPRAAAGRLQMFSIVSSAHRHHLVIEDYLDDVLRRLADAKQNHPADLEPDSPYLLDLLPDRWALAHPKSVRRARIEEKELIADAKRCRRIRARLAARSS